MPVLIRSKAAFSRTSPPRWASASHHHQSFLNNLLWKYVSIVVIGKLGAEILLWHWGMRGLEVCIKEVACLTCSALIQENQFTSNITGRKYFVTDIKGDEVHFKLQNHIYLLTRIHYGIQYVCESITPLNLKMNIHRRKSGCKIFIDHYRNDCKNAMFSIQVIDQLPGNGYGLK